MPDKDDIIACLTCLHRQHELQRPCEKCGSRSLEHIASLRRKHGDHWKEILEADTGKVH